VTLKCSISIRGRRRGRESGDGMMEGGSFYIFWWSPVSRTLAESILFRYSWRRYQSQSSMLIALFIFSIGSFLIFGFIYHIRENLDHAFLIAPKLHNCSQWTSYTLSQGILNAWSSDLMAIYCCWLEKWFIIRFRFRIVRYDEPSNAPMQKHLARWSAMAIHKLFNHCVRL